MNGERVNPPFLPYSQGNPTQIIFKIDIQLFLR